MQDRSQTANKDSAEATSSPHDVHVPKRKISPPSPSTTSPDKKKKKGIVVAESRSQRPDTIYVGNLADGTSESDLRQQFGQDGKIASVWFPRGGGHRYAFVKFTDADSVEKALQREKVKGSRVRVQLAHRQGGQ